MTDYTCTNCGSGKTRVRLDRPSLDDRYAVGVCDECSGGRDDPSKAILRPLLRSDLWDASLIELRRRQKHERQVVRVATGQVRQRDANGNLVPRKPTKAESDEAGEILARWEEQRHD